MHNEKYERSDVIMEFQKITQFNEFEGKWWKVFSTHNWDVKATMLEVFIGQLQLMTARFVNMLNDSDVSTYVSFLDMIMEWYESPILGWVGVECRSTCILQRRCSTKNISVQEVFQFSFFHPKDFATQLTHLSQSHERFVWKEKHSPVVKRSVCGLQDLCYRSAHLHFGRFGRSMNLQLTSNQSLSYRTNTTKDFVVEIQPAIDTVTFWRKILILLDNHISRFRTCDWHEPIKVKDLGFGGGGVICQTFFFWQLEVWKMCRERGWVGSVRKKFTVSLSDWFVLHNL